MSIASGRPIWLPEWPRNGTDVSMPPRPRQMLWPGRTGWSTRRRSAWRSIPAFRFRPIFCAPITGWRTSFIFPRKPNCCVVPGRWAAGRCPVPAWRSARRCGRSSSSRDGSRTWRRWPAISQQRPDSWMRLESVHTSTLAQREETMTAETTPRRFLVRTGLAAAASSLPAMAQNKPTLRFSAVFSEQDISAEMMKKFAEGIANDCVFEGYYGGNLFKQGTELVAIQRGNLEMGKIAPQDISKQIPAWSIVTAGYLFRDAAHVKTFFNSDPGKELKKMAEDQLGVVILGPTYFGVRQVGLKPEKEIKTPADMAGIKLRMPGGDAWQFLGEALGANPTPMAYAEVYTGLQTG